MQGNTVVWLSLEQSMGSQLHVSVSVSFYSDDGFQPMQKELYNNNDKKTE